MVHRRIRLVLKLIDAIDKKECYLRMSTPEMNQYRINDDRIIEYNPKAFRNLRELFCIPSLNLDHRYIFNSKVHSNSGSIFFFSSDFKYIIKTIRENERKTLLDFVDSYYLYLLENPSSLLIKILGCYVLDNVSTCSIGCTKSECTHRHNVLIMKNIFRDTNIAQIYDLKGKELQRNTNSYIKKDISWVEDGNRPIVKPETLEQLRKDVVFLEKNNIMDYSLLVYYTGAQRDKHFKQYDSKDCKIYKASIESDLISGDCIFGIVDILTQYNCLKRTEWVWNTFCLCKNKSSLNPKDYKNRLIQMVEETFVVENTSDECENTCEVNGQVS